jgi:hypothetical protein
MLGADIAKRYGESIKVVNAIAAHHEQVEPLCPETVLVAAAEALSAARPGAGTFRPDRSWPSDRPRVRAGAGAVSVRAVRIRVAAAPAAGGQARCGAVPGPGPPPSAGHGPPGGP